MPPTPNLPQDRPFSIRAYDFSGGLNTRAINSLLQDNELITLENGFFDTVGAIKKRGGSSVFATLGSVTDPTIQALHKFYVSTGFKHFLWSTVGTSGSTNGAVGSLSDTGTGQSVSSISLVQHTNATGSNISQLVPTFTSTPTNGNTVIVLVAGAGANQLVSSVTATGMTFSRLIQYNPGNTGPISIWAATNVQSAGKPVTVKFNTSTSNGFVVFISEYAGIAAINTLDKTASTSGNSSSLNSGTTPTTTTAAELWISILHQAGNGVTQTLSSPTNGFTLVDQAQTAAFNILAGFCHKIVSTTGNASVGLTSTLSNQWNGCLVTLVGIPASPQNSLSTTLHSSPLGFFATATDIEVYVNGIDIPKKITDSSGTLSFGDLGGTPPVAQYLIFHAGRLWLAGDPLAPSTLTFSNSGDIETWPGTNTITVGLNDGSVIRGLGVQFGVLVVYKDTGIYTISGDSPSNFALQKQQATTGCVSPKTIWDMSGIHFFLGRQGSRLGVFTYVNGIVTRISQNIDSSLQGLTLSQITNACAFVDFPYYYLAIPTSSSTVNNLVFAFDASINAWFSITGWQPNVFANWPGGSDLGQLFYGDSNNTGKIIQMFTGTQDQGANFTFRFRSKYFDVGSQESSKHPQIFYLTAESTWPGTGTITYDYDFTNINGASYPNSVSLSSNGWYVFPIANNGQFISFEFKDTSSSSAIISGFSLLGEQMPIRPR